MQVRAFERYIPLKIQSNKILLSSMISIMTLLIRHLHGTTPWRVGQ